MGEDCHIWLIGSHDDVKYIADTMKMSAFVLSPTVKRVVLVDAIVLTCAIDLRLHQTAYKTSRAQLQRASLLSFVKDSRWMSSGCFPMLFVTID